MALFVCDVCGTVDSTDIAYPDGLMDGGKPLTELKCTECQTGTWHELFEKEAYRPEFDVVINRPSGIGLGSEK
ncbi:MAG: hypothetical protein IBX57_00085 [Gammaproteobacteria bacterium]|nr:hypothetical protein [Gammaproteobacteria bacterium]